MVRSSKPTTKKPAQRRAKTSTAKPSPTKKKKAVTKKTPTVRKKVVTKKKRGPGRPTNPIKQEAIKRAKETGKLPHEILLDMARGEKFETKRQEIYYYKTGPNKGMVKEIKWVDTEYYPSFSDMMEAAKAAAPYYAPRLSAQQVTSPPGAAQSSGVMLVPVVDPKNWGVIAKAEQQRLKDDVRK
jgi:hypothetical protein